MDKLKMQTGNVADKNYELLVRAFPNVSRRDCWL